MRGPPTQAALSFLEATAPVFSLRPVLPDTRRTKLSAILLALLVLAAPAVAAAPTDPQAPSQQPLQIMRVGEALDRVGPPLQDVLVFTPDTGLDLDHPDLAARLFSNPVAVPAPAPDGGNPGTVAAGKPGWDIIGNAAENTPFQPDDDPTDPLGGSGHGTAVAGVLGAEWNNGQGGAGVAPNARFVALRTCWDGDNCYQYAQASAIEWAADRGVRVVSMSWLSGALENGFRDSILSNPTVLFVTIPSGGGGPQDADPNSPQPCALSSASDNILCVTTSSPSDEPNCGWYGAASVDVAVPTDNSVTTLNGGTFGAAGCATSYAAPTAAGVATILFGIDPAATPADVKAAIMDSARRVPAWDGKSVTGGVVDALAAVDLFQSRRGIQPREPMPPAQQPAGQQQPPAPESTPDTLAPSLVFDVAPDVFRAGGPGARLASPRGARLVTTVSEPATLTVTFARVLPGRRRAGRCVRPPRRPRGRRCNRLVAAGRFERALRAGTFRIPFAGLDRRGKRLPLGSYRATATARDAAGNVSPKRIATFRIAAR